MIRITKKSQALKLKACDYGAADRGRTGTDFTPRGFKSCCNLSSITLGFDVKALSELLGHSSVEITLNRYVHSSFDQKREYMKRVQMAF